MNASRTGEKGALILSRLGATDASNLNGDGSVHADVCMACMHARARETSRVYDNTISPRLIMIIIKIIIQYFIQIRHTDNFPSMGIRLIIYNSYYRAI